MVYPCEYVEMLFPTLKDNSRSAFFHSQGAVEKSQFFMMRQRILALIDEALEAAIGRSRYHVLMLMCL